MNAQRNNKKQIESNMQGSCEMEDLISIKVSIILQVYPYETVKREFFIFLEKTSQVKENIEILQNVGQNLRLKFNDWLNVEQAIQLFQLNIQYAKRKSIKWSDSDKKLFYWIVMRYYIYKNIKNNRQLTPEEWREISKIVIGRNAHQCRLKWEQKYKIPLSEAPWTEQEDHLLYTVHEEFKKTGKENKWSQIAREIYKRSCNKTFRQPKQCRERWINRLDPNISNEPWDKQQEIDLLKTILMRGKKWSELSTLYGRVRTENSLKNKYNSLLKKEKLKYEFETINPQLFEKVQKLRKDYAKRYGIITPIEEIDNYEWQFIVLAIQGLYIEKCLMEGKVEEAERIGNDNFFDLFQEDTQSKCPKNVLYRKTLNITKVDQNFSLENDKCGIAIFNQKNKKLYITPYNITDFQNIILNQITKRVKIEDNNSVSTLSKSDYPIQQNNNQLKTQSLGNQSIQQLLYLTSQANYYMPMGQSMLNSYWLPPVFPQQIISSSLTNPKNNHYSPQQQSLKMECQRQQQKQEKFDIFDNIGVDIKVVDSGDEQ